MTRPAVQTISTTLEGLLVVARASHQDSRGAFCNLYDYAQFETMLAPRVIRQVNYSLTDRQGTVRGLHYQAPPHNECKIVTCLRGAIFDVAVDLRRDSPTYLKWHSEELSADNHRSLLIPEGFAHGFQTLTDHCAVLYLHTGDYVPQLESGFRHDDPAIAVNWPLPVQIVSDRDRNLPSTEGFGGLARE